MAYRPGMGLNREAIERLRERKLAEAAKTGMGLPAVDDSEQANTLLGNGAQKKMRCGLCTRPLDDEAIGERRAICERCEPKPPCEGRERNDRRDRDERRDHDTRLDRRGRLEPDVVRDRDERRDRSRSHEGRRGRDQRRDPEETRRERDKVAGLGSKEAVRLQANIDNMMESKRAYKQAEEKPKGKMTRGEMVKQTKKNGKKKATGKKNHHDKKTKSKETKQSSSTAPSSSDGSSDS